MAYANLAMAHIAYEDSVSDYLPKHYAIRKKIYFNLLKGKINTRSIFDDEKIKIELSNVCSYCGSKEKIAIDHVIPKSKGGKDSGDNLIPACQTCNSSKRDMDLLTWLRSQNKLPSILVYRRYLKLAIAYFDEHKLMNREVSPTIKTPFDVGSLFEHELNLSKLKLTSSQKVSNFRVANWNLEKTKKGKKLDRQLEQIRKVNPDIIGLTELTNDFNLSELAYNLVTKPLNDSSHDLTAGIFSKWPIIETVDTYDSTQAVCALINSPLGKIIVYVSIIPYHKSGVSGGKFGNLGYTLWQMHKEHIEYLCKDWEKIKSKYKDLPLICMGDYNQVRDGSPKGYGTKECRDLLTNSLNYNKLICLTEIDFKAIGLLTPDPKSGKTRRNIDHICMSKSLFDELGNINISAWNHFNESGQYMSDHNGTYVDIAYRVDY